MNDLKARADESSEEANGPHNEQKVGYGRPPLHSRFKPGKSGNPRGRPKGSKSLDAIAHELLMRKVSIQDGGVRRKVSLVEAVLLTSSQRALQGDHRAAKMILELSRSVNELTQEEEATHVNVAEDQALLADYLARHQKLER